jgi:ABC-type antimicrobial peptide transport system permease subunit
MKNKLFVFINVLGLAIALACCIVAYLNWEFNAEFDSQHINAEKIYRVNFIRITNGEPIKNGDCPMPLGDIIRQNFSQVREVIRLYPSGGNFKVGDELFRTSVTCVDPGFFDVFTFTMIHGNGDYLNDKTRIFISDELAEKHFPDIEDPVGQLVTYINGEDRIEYIVGGVFYKPPQNSSFQAEAYVHFDNCLDVEDWDENDWSLFNTTFITIENPKDVPAIEEAMQNYVEIQNRAKEDYKVDEYYLDPFVGMAVRAEREDIWNHWTNDSLPVAAATAPGIMAILILLLACFNFTNTSIAMANKRIKEIGIRKVLGSGRNQLIGQFLGENIMMAFFALIGGILIAYFLVPLYSEMWIFLEIRLNLLESVDFIGFLLLLLILTGVIAGSYPAFYVSSFHPASILKGTQKYGGTNLFTRILLTLQYAISIIAIISGFVFSQNAEYQKKYDLGFDMESVVFAYVSDRSGYQTLKNELTGYNNIKSIAGSTHNIASSWYTDPIIFETSELDVSLMDIGDGYLETIGASLIEGRDFIKDSQNDVENSVIVNEELVRVLNWEEPIGKRIILKDTIELFVVGVVKDIFLNGGLWNPVQPLLLRYSLEDNYRFLSVKADVENIKDVHDYMESKWKEVFPDELPAVSYMDMSKVETTLINTNIRTIFLFLGIVALFLSSIGLFSLVSLNIIKRTKEIGVRKVLGASIPRIVNHMSREFIIILAISSILGSIAGYFLSDMLMASIWVYYLTIGLSPFVFSILILFIISAITVGGKIIKAASLNPAYTLRDE